MCLVSGQFYADNGSDDVKVTADQIKTHALSGLVLDEDDMASNSATQVPSQQSVKAYVDAGDAAEASARGTAITSAVAAEAVLRTAADALKADIASPTFTGVPAAPTATYNTNTTQLATMAALYAWTHLPVARLGLP